MSLSLNYLVHSSKWRVELGVWEVLFFPVPEEIVYSFFGIFWNNTNLAYVRYITVWIRGFVYDYPFQRESHSLRDMDFFCYIVTYFAPFGVIENRVAKFNLKYFNGNFHHFVCPG